MTGRAGQVDNRQQHVRGDGKRHPCADCGQDLPIYTPDQWVPAFVYCPACGAPHGDWDRVGPRMVPVDEDLRVSPWRRRGRPAIVGQYDVQFRTYILRLHWDGRDWRWRGRRLIDTELNVWRGSWRADDN